MLDHLGKKILTICEYGNSRSVALAWMLKEQHGKEAIAIGICCTSPETFAMMCAWADTIIVTVGHISHPILNVFGGKVKVWDVGRDVYFLGYKEELIKKYQEYINQEGDTV